MDFNIGNLVSAAVGAVTKVANAVIDFFSPIAEGGGILGGLAGVAVDLAEAVLGAVPGTADVNGDGEIDAEEAEEIFNDVLKVMLGGMIVAFGSVSEVSNSQSDKEDSDVGKEGQEIWIPPTLYDYDKDSEKYSISSQNLLLDLSQQWFDAKTSEDKKKIERQLLYFRANIPSDDIIDRKFEEGINEVLAGPVSQIILNTVGGSEEVLTYKMRDLDKSEANYVLGQYNDDNYNKDIDIEMILQARSKPQETGDPNSVRIQRDANGNISKYTQFGENGELIKEVRITGKEHGNIPRPNVKEPRFNINEKTGEKFQNGYKVRAAEGWEMPPIRPVP